MAGRVSTPDPLHRSFAGVGDHFMGQIYRAITKAQSENQLQPAVADAALPGTAGRTPSEISAAVLAAAKLGPDEIEGQSLGELRETLLVLEAALADPLGWLQQRGCTAGAADRTVRAGFVRTLLGRKCRVLGRIDFLISESKIQKLKLLVEEVRERRLRAALIRELNELAAKNELVQAEYRSLGEALERTAGAPAGEGRGRPSGEQP